MKIYHLEDCLRDLCVFFKHRQFNGQQSWFLCYKMEIWFVCAWSHAVHVSHVPSDHDGVFGRLMCLLATTVICLPIVATSVTTTTTIIYLSVAATSATATITTCLSTVCLHFVVTSVTATTTITTVIPSKLCNFVLLQVGDVLA